MPNDEIFIAPFREGERRDVDSWLLPNEAFDTLENVYIYRGVLRKRNGYTVVGQMGIFVDDESIDTGDGGKTYSGTTSNQPVISGSFSTSDDQGPQETFTDNSDGTLTGSAGGTGTIVYLTGAWTLAYNANLVGGGAVTADYHYSSTAAGRKIRGLFNLENSLTSDSLIACDRNYLSVYDTTFDYFENKPNVGGTYDHFSGATEAFHATSFQNVLYLTDGVDGSNSSGMWTYTPSSGLVADFSPESASGIDINKCKRLIPYYKRLVALSPVEGTTHERQRARASAENDATLWRTDIIGEGVSVDAATNESIVDGGIVHDVLVVAFERSIWVLEYTGDYTPFRWRQLESNLEINASYGTIETENMIIFVGHGGIYGCDGVNVERIDKKIPDLVLEDINLEYMNKIYSAYDRNLDQCLISYPKGQDALENNRTLAFGLTDGWFSEYDFGMHALGRYIRLADSTFASLGSTTLWSAYEGKLFKELANQAREDLLLGGKDQGYVYSINEDSASQDEPEGVATNYNFDIQSKRFTPYIEGGIKAQLSHIDFFVTNTENGQMSIDLYENEDTSRYKTKILDFKGSPTTNAKVWKRLNISHIANAHKFKLYLSAAQLADSKMGTVISRIHAAKLSFKPAGKIRLS